MRHQTLKLKLQHHGSLAKDDDQTMIPKGIKQLSQVEGLKAVRKLINLISSRLIEMDRQSVVNWARK